MTPTVVCNSRKSVVIATLEKKRIDHGDKAGE